MAEQSQARQLSTAFPTPPPFYKHFTKQNVVKVRELRKEAAKNRNGEAEDESQAADAMDVLSLPPELRYLVPPEPPTDGRYKSFGADYDLAQPTQSLEAAGIEQLYPATAAESSQFDPTVHLTTLTRAVSVGLIELFGTMSVNPTQGTEKIADMQTLFYNIHDLINRYRPFQAKESLALLLEERIEEKRSEIAKIKAANEKFVVELQAMQRLADSLPATFEPDTAAPSLAKDKGVEAQKKRLDAQKAMWDALDTEVED